MELHFFGSRFETRWWCGFEFRGKANSSWIGGPFRMVFFLKNYCWNWNPTAFWQFLILLNPSKEIDMQINQKSSPPALSSIRTEIFIPPISHPKNESLNSISPRSNLKHLLLQRLRRPKAQLLFFDPIIIWRWSSLEMYYKKLIDNSDIFDR